jgi:large subunit ribosomal protein L22
MTQVTAKLSRLRIAPRKVRLIADLVKGMDTKEAEFQLRYFTKRGAEPISKLIASAVANAHANAKVAVSEALFIKDIRVDEGPAFKRSMPRARGRASMIKKRTSHVALVLETR